MTDETQKENENQEALDQQEFVGAESARPEDAQDARPDLNDEEFSAQLNAQEDDALEEKNRAAEKFLDEKHKKQALDKLSEEEREAEEEKLKYMKEMVRQINGFHHFLNMPGDFDPNTIGEIAKVSTQGKNLVLTLADKSGQVVNNGKKVSFIGDQMTPSAAKVIAAEIVSHGWSSIKLKGTPQEKTMMAANLIQLDPNALTNDGLHYNDLKEAVQSGEMSMDDYHQKIEEVINNYDSRITPTLGATVTKFSLKNQNVRSMIMNMIQFDAPKEKPSAEQALDHAEIISNQEHGVSFNQVEQALKNNLDDIEIAAKGLTSEQEALTREIVEAKTDAQLDDLEERENELNTKGEKIKASYDHASIVMDKLHDLGGSSSLKNQGDVFKLPPTMLTQDNRVKSVAQLDDALNALADHYGHRPNHPDRERKKDLGANFQANGPSNTNKPSAQPQTPKQPK